jgi:hypothetical protein
MENDEIEDPEEEVEEAPPPDFDVGDLCVTLVPIKRNFGTIPEGTSVEIKRKFIRSKKTHYDVEKLPCDCGLTLQINAVPIDQLEDYEDRYPSL